MYCTIVMPYTVHDELDAKKVFLIFILQIGANSTINRIARSTLSTVERLSKKEFEYKSYI